MLIKKRCAMALSTFCIATAITDGVKRTSTHRVDKPTQHQLEFSWPDTASFPPTSAADSNSVEAVSESADPPECSATEPSVSPMLKGLHIPQPRPEAVEFGVFGHEEGGPIRPDRDQIIAIVEEQALELLNVLLDLETVKDGLENGIDPRTGKMPRTEAQRAKLQEHLQSSERKLKASHEDILAVYADAFGEENARLLDEQVQLWVHGRISPAPQYHPGHPWYYCARGDNQPPIPVDAIEANPDLAATFNEKLPRDPSKRREKLKVLMETEVDQVQRAKLRYQDIAEHGAEALTEYDRNIAYSGDLEMARSESLALVHNHIRYGLSRIQWLKAKLQEGDGG